MIAAVAVLPHLPGLSGGFVYDDFRFVKDNSGIQHWGEPWELLFSPSRMTVEPDLDIWRPLRTLFFAIQFSFFGLHPAGYHAFSLLIFLGVVRALLELARQLGVQETPALFFIGLLFGWHPLTVESVAWISSQGDLLAALFACLALALAGRRPALSLIALGAALLGKESAAPAFLVLFLAGRCWRPDARPTRKDWLAALIVLIAYVALRQWILGRNFTAGGQGFGQIDAMLADRVLVFAQNIVLFLRLFLFPWRLSVDYGDGYPREPGLVDLLGAGALIAALVFWFVRSRQPPVIRLGLIFAGAFFLPTSGLLFAMRNPTAERFHLLPTAGMALCVGATLWQLRTPLRWPLVCTVLVLLGTRSTLRTLDWRGQIPLFEAELAFHPESIEAHMAVGAEHAINGDLPRAVPHYQEVLRLTAEGDARRIKTLFNLAVLQIEAEDRTAAIPTLEQCRAEMLATGTPPPQESELARTWALLGNLYLTRVGPEPAEEVLQEGLRWLGERPDLLTELAFLRLRAGAPEDALPLYEAAVAAGGSGPRLFTQLGDTLLRLQRSEEATVWLQRALQLDPRYPPALRLLQKGG